ncbi:MAG: catalase [Roseburia sp.]|nr:catalase [Roseburia sp.]
MKAWKHYCTITHHKHLVMKGCFAVGLYKQGLLHDLSKYTPTEFLVGCKYYQGTMSPNNAERKDKGYSSAWLHHKGRNKHHMEYWIDYGVPGDDGEHGGMCGMKMPVRYVVEMYVDRVAASKNYQKERYTDRSALDYYLNGQKFHILHEDTKALLELLLYMLAARGEKETNAFIRGELLKGQIPYEKAFLVEKAEPYRKAVEQ